MLSGYMGVATSIDGTRTMGVICFICLESFLHLPTEIVQERNGNSSFVVLHWAAFSYTLNLLFDAWLIKFTYA